MNTNHDGLLLQDHLNPSHNSQGVKEELIIYNNQKQKIKVIAII